MLKLIIQAAAFAAAVMSSVPAQAEENLPGVRVYYGDLDLSAPAGIRALDRRLSRAIAAACPSDDAVHELSELRSIALCREGKHAEVAPLRELALSSARRGNTVAAAH